MWKIEPTDKYVRDHRWYSKKRPNELKAVLNNLDTYVKAIQGGTKPLQVNAGFIHIEGQGVIAIDQKGGKGKLAQTRLYVYPDSDREVLYLFTIGDKNTQ